MLGALSFRPAEIFASGPFSNRGGSTTDDMATFIGLTPSQASAWSKRIARFKEQYASGIVALDRLADGDFITAPAATKDSILSKDPNGFTTLLFTHAIEGMYSVPEYGGNADLVGWREIDFPGDRLPNGYTPAEVSMSDGPDVYVPTGVGKQLLGLIQSS
jgi:hypothetical protein